MKQSRFRMAQQRVIFIHCLYVAKLNPVLRIDNIDQIVELWNADLMIAGQCWFEPAVRHYFSSNNVRLLAYVFTQLDLLKRNESNRVYWFQENILIFCVFVSCLSRKVPALNIFLNRNRQNNK